MLVKASKKQQRLAALIKEAGDSIRIDDAVKVFGVDRQKAAKLLAELVKPYLIVKQEQVYRCLDCVCTYCGSDYAQKKLMSQNIYSTT